MKPEISLSPVAIKQIEEILSAGKGVDIVVIREKHGNRLVIREYAKKKKYDVVFGEC